MKIAVLTLTRDRLEYTQHCFAKLRENAGCEYDHFVLDQGSKDATPDWLARHQGMAGLDLLRENVGITRGMNKLLDRVAGRYDVVVKFDNDCELLNPGTLRDVAHLALAGDAILSPRILGLMQPPQAIGEYAIEGYVIKDIPQIGGIFLAVPSRLYDEFGFRYDEANDQDDVQICWWWRGQGGRCGYVSRLEANHYETTAGQQERYPAYFERKYAEAGVAWPSA